MLAPTATPTFTPTPIEIELIELLREYELNKVRADARLRYRNNGKIPISTSGYVSEVEEFYVDISPSESPYDEVRCYYSDIRTAFHIEKEQFISV